MDYNAYLTRGSDMNIEKQLEFEINPVYLAALINGDHSGLEDWESEAIDGFERDLGIVFELKNVSYQYDDEQCDNWKRCEISMEFSDCYTVSVYGEKRRLGL